MLPVALCLVLSKVSLRQTAEAFTKDVVRSKPCKERAYANKAYRILPLLWPESCCLSGSPGRWGPHDPKSSELSPGLFPAAPHKLPSASGMTCSCWPWQACPQDQVRMRRNLQIRQISPRTQYDVNTTACNRSSPTSASVPFPEGLHNSDSTDLPNGQRTVLHLSTTT